MQCKVEICGINTSKLKVLKNEEMLELMKRMRQGDDRAREQLIEGNLRLVLSVIQKFVGRGENPDDLFQVGCIGLLKAVKNFDETKMVRFSTYGVPMIAGEIRRYLRDNSSIRVSRSVRDTAYRVLQCKEKMISEQQKEPTMEEIAEKLEIPVEDVIFAMDAITAPVSLFEPVYSDGGDPLTVMDQIDLREAVGKLSDREKRILALRFFDGKTQMEVASEVGISQAQVSRLEKTALGAIRKSITVS